MTQFEARAVLALLAVSAAAAAYRAVSDLRDIRRGEFLGSYSGSSLLFRATLFGLFVSLVVVFASSESPNQPAPESSARRPGAESPRAR